MLPSAGSFTIRRATLHDLPVLVANMRPADRAELTACSGPDLARTVRASFDITPNAFAWVDGDSLVAVGGIAPVCLLTGTGSPWMVGTSLLDSFPSALTRGAKTYLRRMQRTYPIQVNYVDARNVRSVRWLRRLGFTIHPAEPHGVAGLPFHRFEKDMNHV
jgi:hypothetical protein